VERSRKMGLVLLLSLLAAVSVLAGCLAGFSVRRFFSPDPSRAATYAVGEELRRRRWASFVHDRLDRAKATGLALTVGVVCITIVGTVVGVLAYLVRTKTSLVTGDERAATWAAAHATPASAHALRVITQLGSSVVVITLAVLVAVLDY